MTLCSAGLESLIAKGTMPLLGDIRIPLNWKVRLPPCHLEFFMPHGSSTSKEGVSALAGITDPENDRKTGLLLPSSGKEEYI